MLFPDGALVRSGRHSVAGIDIGSRVCQALQLRARQLLVHVQFPRQIVYPDHEPLLLGVLLVLELVHTLLSCVPAAGQVKAFELVAIGLGNSLPYQSLTSLCNLMVTVTEAPGSMMPRSGLTR